METELDLFGLWCVIPKNVKRVPDANHRSCVLIFAQTDKTEYFRLLADF